ncbi:MAG: response regulator [Bryobacterales bacterium]|nr:response regulator [Bryobacterales bacterium]
MRLPTGEPARPFGVPAGSAETGWLGIPAMELTVAGPAPGSSSDGSTHERVWRLLAERSAPGGLMYIVILAIVGLATPISERHPVLYGFSMAGTAVFGLLRFFAARRISQGDRSEVWRLRLRSGLYGNFLVYGVFAALSARCCLTDWSGSLIVVAGAGLAAGAISALAPDPRLAVRALAILVCPTTVASLVRGDAPGFAIAALSMVFLSLLLIQLRLCSRDFWNAVHVEEMAAARKQAESTAAHKTELLASMSHEIRTPMYGVVGALQLILQTPLDREQQDYARMCLTSAENLVSVLNAILEYSKGEAGRITVVSAPLDLRQTIETAVAPFRLCAQQKGLGFETDIALVKTCFLGDAARIGQVVTNLVSNAVKFTRYGAVRVRADIEGQPGEPGLVVIRVIDTGIGIGTEARTKLFKPFVQVHHDEPDVLGGTGLGLAISRQLAEAMGGSLVLERTGAWGSTFRFQLALAETPRKPETSHAKPPRLQGRVLLAEDNLLNQRITARLLEKAGVDVQIASDGVQAVEALQAGEYDLILMDNLMPRLNGVDATRQIRAMERDRRTPIVAVSANALEDQTQELRMAGADDFLHKPFHPNELYMVLERYLPKGNVRSAAAGA